MRAWGEGADGAGSGHVDAGGDWVVQRDEEPPRVRHRWR